MNTSMSRWRSVGRSVIPWRHCSISSGESCAVEVLAESLLWEEVDVAEEVEAAEAAEAADSVRACLACDTTALPLSSPSVSSPERPRGR